MEKEKQNNETESEKYKEEEEAEEQDEEENEESNEDDEKEDKKQEIENLIKNGINVGSYNDYINYLYPQQNNENENHLNIDGGQQNPSLDDKSSTLYKKIDNFMDDKGWILYNKDGIKITNFTSFDLFEYLTNNVVSKNIKLNNYYITPKDSDKIYKGGELYIKFLNIMPLVLDSRKKAFLNKFENKSLFLTNNYNNNGYNFQNNDNFNFQI